MTMQWATLETAFAGRNNAADALDALVVSSMRDVETMLEGIGAGEAGRMLAEALRAESRERRTKLAASLGIIDKHLPVGRVKRQILNLQQWVWAGERPAGDALRSALLASLMDSELGGDPERLRERISTASTWWEEAIAPELSALPASDRSAEMSTARRVLQNVVQLLLRDVQSRYTREQ
jgi:hypothetical protein